MRGVHIWPWGRIALRRSGVYLKSDRCSGVREIKGQRVLETQNHVPNLELSEDLKHSRKS